MVKRIHFIKRAQKLGFSLKEITELLMLRVDGQTSCEEVKQHTEAKIAEVEQKLISLQHMRQVLLKVAALCTGEGPASACPMLDALDQQEAFDQIADRADATCPTCWPVEMLTHVQESSGLPEDLPPTRR